MSALSSVYDRLLRTYAASTGSRRLATKAALGLMIRVLTRLGDPEVVVSLRGMRLRMPISHRLPLYVAADPSYDHVPIRLSRFLRARHGHLSLVDVGANIGDTVRACQERADDRFLAIEPNPKFARYFRKNCGDIEHCRLLEIACSSADGASEFRIAEERGTAVVVEQAGGRVIEKKTLDTIVDEFPEHAGFNLLKIDTDGHDFEVLRGGKKSIVRNRPAVLFECDPFDNAHYVEDFVAAVRLFARAGYSRAIVYDNFGYLFGVLDLHSVSDFKFSLIYQLVSNFYYFDVLVLQDDEIEDFLEAEMAHFVAQIPNESLGRAAGVAAGL